MCFGGGGGGGGVVCDGELWGNDREKEREGKKTQRAQAWRVGMLETTGPPSHIARSQLHTVSPEAWAKAKRNLHLTPLGKIYMAAVASCQASVGV